MTLILGYLLLLDASGKQLLSSRTIGELVGVSKTTVNNERNFAASQGLFDKNLNGWERTRKISDIVNLRKSNRKRNCGNKKKTSHRADRLIRKLTIRHRSSTADEILGLLSRFYNVNISKSTFKRRLREFGIKSHKRTNKFMLNEKMIKKRRLWARQMKRTMTQRMWNNVAWSDESIVQWNMFYGERVYRTNDEKLHPDVVNKRVKHPIQVMVWGVVSTKGVGELYFVEGYMNSAKYIEVLNDIIRPQLTRWFGRSRSYHFMHDLAPCHRAKASMAEIRRLNIRMFDWPSNAPDMNPIENVWRVLKIETKKLLKNQEFRRSVEGLSNIEILKTAILTAWNGRAVKKAAIKSCFNMPKRIDALIKARGMWTKY